MSLNLQIILPLLSIVVLVAYSPLHLSLRECFLMLVLGFFFQGNHLGYNDGFLGGLFINISKEIRGARSYLSNTNDCKISNASSRCHLIACCLIFD